MSEYNFKPNYEDWWKRKNLKMEDVIWLILGINPDDVHCGREYEKSNKTKDSWYWAFYNYVELIYPGRRIGEYYAIYSKILDGVKKKDAFQIIYNNHNPIHTDALSFAKSCGFIKTEKELEKYTDHNLFLLNFEDFDLSSIQTEIQALGVLLGFSPIYFQRYKELFDKVQDEIHKVDSFYLCSLTNEERWFYDEFGKCIRSHIDVLDKHHLFDNVQKLIDLKIWKNDFSLYVQESYNEGFSFDEEIYNSLAQRGVNKPEYTQGSWAIQYYMSWIKRRPVWDVQTAASLYRGANPDGGREFWVLNKKEEQRTAGHALLMDSVVYLSTDWKFLDEKRLSDFVQEHILAKALQESGKNKDGQYLFKPKEIVQFFRDYCPNTYQPIALFQALGIHEEPSKIQNGNNSGTIAGEKQCQRWLVGLMANDSKPQGSKNYYMGEALGNFRISERGFKRAWDLAKNETNNSHWSKPGRR